MAKKIIKGKTYNTSTSYHICTRIREMRNHKNDAHIEIYEHLNMRKKDNEYFIHTLLFTFNNEGKVVFSTEGIDTADAHTIEAFKSREYRTTEFID